MRYLKKLNWTKVGDRNVPDSLVRNKRVAKIDNFVQNDALPCILHLEGDKYIEFWCSNNEAALVCDAYFEF